MRYFQFLLLLLVMLMALAMVGSASADTGNTMPKSSIPSDPGIPDGREGGETVADAFVIPALPFSDTGNTSDNVDDYDEACPYSGSMAPDLVYAFTPAADGAIDIDLCESLYDTKVFVYENAVTPGAPYDCNDDFSDCALLYRSRLESMPVTAGNTYYIIIDGYGSEMGDYILYVTDAPPPPPPCELECPAGGVAEGEPPIVDGYVDEYNGGCNSDPFVFQDIDFPVLCGVSGWYMNDAGGSSRDTDWFPVIADAGGYITTSCVAEYDCYLFVLLPLDCGVISPIVYDAVCQCEIPGVIEFGHPAGTGAWLWVGPTVFSGPVYEFDYNLEVGGIVYGDTPTDNVSWGDVKSMFK